MNITQICDAIKKVYDKAIRVPAKQIPPFLIWCSFIKRPGLSVIVSVGKILESLNKRGIPTEEGPDGTPNHTNKMVFCIVNEIYRAMKEDFSMQIALGPGAITVNVSGANAGGPFVASGTNINVASGGGIGQ